MVLKNWNNIYRCRKRRRHRPLHIFSRDAPSSSCKVQKCDEVQHPWRRSRSWFVDELSSCRRDVAFWCPRRIVKVRHIVRARMQQRMPERVVASRHLERHWESESVSRHLQWSVVAEKGVHPSAKVKMSHTIAIVNSTIEFNDLSVAITQSYIFHTSRRRLHTFALICIYWLSERFLLIINNEYLLNWFIPQNSKFSFSISKSLRSTEFFI